MARGSKTVTQLAGELGVSPSMLHRWRERFEAELDNGVPQKSQGEREEVEQLNFASSPIWLSERFGGAWVTIYENGCVVSSGDGNEEIREYVICRIADGNCNGWGGLCPAENLDLWALLAQAQQNARDRFFSDPAVSVARTAIVQAFELGRNDVGGIHIVRP